VSGVVERTALGENWSVCLAPEGNDDFAKEFEGNCGLLLGGVLWVAREAFHYDVMENLVYPICGDWGQLGVARSAWLSLQGGCLDISGNFDEMANLPETVWADDGTDKTPTAFRARMGTVAANFGHYASASELTAQLVDNLIEVGKAAAEGLSLIISLISETLERIIIEAAIPVVGWIAGAVEAGVFVTRFWNMVTKALKLIERIARTIEKVVTVLQRVVRVLKCLKTTLAFFNGTLAGANAANTPGAVQHGFGVTA